MSDDSIKLSWNDVSGVELPAGAYIVAEGGEKYRLLDPYTPEQKSEDEWKYEPKFESRTSAWSRVPLFFYTYDNNGNIISREPDWNLTDNAQNFGNYIAKAISTETGEEWTAIVAHDLSGYKTISFQSTDIVSALNQIVNDFETEWLADKTTNTLYIGKAMFDYSDDIPVLNVGANIKVPSVTDSKEGYYNRFYVFGSTRNITQEYHGANVNNLINKRLTLDPVKYPGGYIDTRKSQSEPIMSKILTFDSIYPKSNLIVTEARPRLMYTIKEGTTDEKIIIGTDENGQPIYDQYTIWYVQLATKDENGKITPFRLANKEIYTEKNPNGVLISGKVLSIHFSSGALNSREFEVNYHDEAKELHNSDGVDFNVKVGDFEIYKTTDNNFVIPAMTGVVPNVDDTAILFNLRMPSEYIAGAYLELEEAAKKEIADIYTADRNNYEFASNPVAFANDETLLNLRVGQRVIYKSGDYQYETRILSITRKLDLPFEQTIKVGNDRIKGNTETLREDVANANKDINLIAAFNQLTQQTINNYSRAMASMTEGFERISRMWYFDSKYPGAIFSDFTAVTKGDLVTHYAGEPVDIPTYITSESLEARLKELNVGVGGLDMEALESYLTENSYATQDWVKSQGFLTGVLGNWVDKAGDTMSGALTINTSETPLILNSNQAIGSFTRYNINGSDKATSGYYNGLAYISNEVCYARIGVNDSGTPMYWTDYTGANTHVLWHAGNMGSGSGLNADLLDGYHESSFFKNLTFFDNANDIFNNGVYRTGNGIINCPNAYAGNQLLHFNWDINAANQLWLAFDRDEMWFRRKAANSWHSWKKVLLLNWLNSISGINEIDMTGGIVSGGRTDGCYMGAASDGLGANYKGGLFYSYGSNPLYFYVDNIERMKISSGGVIDINYSTSTSGIELTRSNNSANAECSIAFNTYGKRYVHGVWDSAGDGDVGYHIWHHTLGNIFNITYGGNVGIKTINPQFALDVVGSIRNSDWFYSSGNNGWYNHKFDGGIWMDDPTWVKTYKKPLFSGEVFYNGPGTFGVGLKCYHHDHTSVEVQGGNYTMGLGCHSNGHWYWWRGTNGTDSANKSYVMDYDGSQWQFAGTIVASGNLTALSDSRVKEHITDLTWRGRLQPKRYWKDNRWQIGFIAQEVDPIVSEAVFKNDLWSLDYGGLVAYAILQGNMNSDSIKTQERELSEVRSELREVKKEVRALRIENQKLRKLLSA